MAYATFPDLSPGDQFTATHTDLIRSNFTDHESRLLSVPSYPSFANDQREVHTLPLPYIVAATTITSAHVIFSGSAGGAAAEHYDATNKWSDARVTLTSNGDIVYWAGNVGSCPVDLLPEFRVVCAHESLVTSTIRLGYVDQNTTADAANAVMFRSANGGNWFAVVRKAGVETTTDTTVAASTTPREFKIIQDSATQVTFYIANNSVRVETGANIPASGTVLRPRVRFDGTASTMLARFGTTMYWAHEVKSS
jgi:hypothetical protein